MSGYNSKGDHYMNSIDSTGAMVTKAAPAIGGTAWSLSALPLADIAAMLTIIYTTFLIGDWIWKKVKAYREWKAEQ